MPGAREFLERCIDSGLNVILLTSRNIGEYPNLMMDTVQWLKMNELPYDFIWWAKNKTEKLVERDVLHNVVLAVDDDLRFVKQFDGMNVSTYWIRQNGDWDMTAAELLINTRFVRSLDEINIKKEMSFNG